MSMAEMKYIKYIDKRCKTAFRDRLWVLADEHRNHIGKNILKQ